MTGIDLRPFFRHPFARLTSSVAFIPQIDGLRTLAMFLVFMHHVFAIYLETTHRLGTQSLPRDWGMIFSRSPLVPWALNLNIGIPFFCAISGFVLTIPFARSRFKGVAPPSRGLYLLRRLIRMEPPYIINLVFMFFMLATRFRPPAAGQLSLYVTYLVYRHHLYASLLYLHALIFEEPSWINGVCWTLEIEAQFYLLLPFLAELFRIRHNTIRRLLFMGLILASALFAQFAIPSIGSARLSLSLASQLQYFLAGVLLADIYVDQPRALQLRQRTADGVVLLCVISLVYVLHWQHALLWTEPFLIVGLFFGVFYGAWSGRLFALPALTIPGGMCYTIYLYHFFLVRNLMPWSVRFLPPTHSLWLDVGVQIVVMAIPVFLVSTILSVVTERPFVILSHEVARRFRTPTVTAQAGT